MSGAAGQHPPANSASNKPSVLIIGGLGYVGRFLAHYIHTNSLASTLRIVDKQLPQLALLSPEHTECCSEPNFVQADASRPQSLVRIFDLPSGAQFDYVFNCGGETRYSQEDEVYKARSHALSLNIGQEAAKRKVKAFVELSTGQVYDPKRDPPRKETDKLKPALRQAKWKLQAEEDLSKIPGLNLVILRLANVYGPYVGRWLGTQLALARVYQDLEKELKYLWSADLRTNTVHVDDTVRACWAAVEWRASGGRPTTSSSSAPKGPGGEAAVFNVVDSGKTSQGTMAGIIKDLFGISTGFQNTLINTFARLNLEHVVDDVNDETLDPWADLLHSAGIDSGASGPLSPFMEKELLRDLDLSMDGEKFVRTTGFEYKHPRITKEECQAVIESYKRMKWWP
ncbi:NAD(P)-binding protein [Myriangium duriaei CBS 260.36]|uniref:NAD(P)-binding protein n=1 Tax=Myriangium duriaei CBS 260.36 TaxID=1168546 RepID=A0A9P4J4H8_9PEZI|nr:NAD(P)-binding protein [Myriangium duriaei CBS 260.36]